MSSMYNFQTYRPVYERPLDRDNEGQLASTRNPEMEMHHVQAPGQVSVRLRRYP